ncbi:unnamed protein product [Fusarium graminearum]|uniref:Uncharacterized protein n=1 Tax=Gibberella zeae TaxID=5518 RepID=A0A9N8NFF6_GIBZA|nr:hypothetical protein HG531_008455 [Fusarium graminearum]CAG1971655.1 unnamed protein product [Fusarium graminearum]
MGALDNFEPTKIMPSDEVELRREYAKCIDARMKFYDPTFKMNSVHLASIITTPLDSLDQIRRMSLMGSFLGSLPPLLKRYLIENSGIPKSYLTADPKRSIPGDSEHQRNLCRKRDSYTCVFLPNTQNDYLKNRYRVLKCLGIEYTQDDAKATVIIQLTQIYRTTNHPMENVTLEGDGNHFDDILTGMQMFEHQCHLPCIQYQPSAISMVSGKCARIEMSRGDAKKCKVMLDIA